MLHCAAAAAPADRNVSVSQEFCTQNAFHLSEVDNMLWPDHNIHPSCCVKQVKIPYMSLKLASPLPGSVELMQIHSSF